MMLNIFDQMKKWKYCNTYSWIEFYLVIDVLCKMVVLFAIKFCKVFVKINVSYVAVVLHFVRYFEIKLTWNFTIGVPHAAVVL